MALELLDENDRIEVKDSELEDVNDPDQDAAYTLRPISTTKQREITKRHTDHVLNRHTGRKEPKVDGDKVADDLLDFALVSWSGIVHKGKSLPCEREYKLQLDAVRKSGLLIIAGLNRTEREAQAKAESFRSPA